MAKSNCPQCSHRLGLSTAAPGLLGLCAKCPNCGWESEEIWDLIERSPSCNSAKLKASGAEPGWYGPDGQKCGDGYQRPDMVWWRHTLFTQQEARLCGFVEVK